jgi:hypothetical protein
MSSQAPPGLGQSVSAHSGSSKLFAELLNRVDTTRAS